MTGLKTAITAAAVYPDRARVSRSGTMALKPGSHRLELSDLPLSLDPASVRASARGTARARLLGVDVRRDFYVETPAERVRELEKQIEALEDEMGGLDAQVELLQRESASLGELAGQAKAFAHGLAYGKTTPEAQMAVFDSLRGRAEEVNTALLDLAVQRRDLERRLQKLRNELAQMQGGGQRERYTAVVEVEVTQAGDLTVELTYVVSKAGWRPLYDVRLLEEGGESILEVGYLAQVTQRSGEDWTDVALTLSTARPALAETLPELKPWYVGPLVAPPMPRAKMMLGSAAPAGIAPAPMIDKEMALQAAVEAGEGVKEEKAEVAVAKVDTSGAAVTYQVPGAITVPADGAPHKVAVAGFELKPELDYVTAPKLVEAVYRRAQVTNDSPYTLLPGPANLFAGDEFIGATELELVAPQGEIELYLGPDDRVKVERELKRREVDKKFIGDKRRLHYAYEITLENLLSSEARVTLHDQIPVSRHEDVKVKLSSAEPEPSEQSELNLLDWELTLAPGEKRDVRFGFTVEHPRAMRLTGLP
ncbi:MAG: mucoidy inhibitor MuiA family protein [Anaerolineae bacterium]|nr:mucoidy inhibitor MuiA family protein [Anaerolineae bacterium]